MATEIKENDILEETDRIKVENADIGKFNIYIYITITIICLIYLVTHLKK